MTTPQTIDVFIAYAKADAPLLDRLRVQLSTAERIGLVNAWHDGEIQAGSDRKEAIAKALNEAEIILLLISADFLASEFSYEEEMERALQLHKQGKAIVVPVILKECSWKLTPLEKLKVLPQNQIPVNNRHWQSPDHAFQEVIKKVVEISNAFRSGKDAKTIQNTFSETTISPTPLSPTQETKPVEKTITVSKNIRKSTPTKKAANSNSVWKYAAVGLAIFFCISLWAFFPRAEKITQNPAPSKTLEETHPKKNTPVKEERPIRSKTRTNLPFISIDGLDWMTQNLNETTQEGSWCLNNQADNCTKHGRHYLYKTATTACPKGWRLPTKKEWQLVLETAAVQRLNLQSSGLYNKTARDFNRKGYYWSSDRSTAGEAWCFEFSKTNQRMERRYVHWGLSCRCVSESQ